MYEDIIFVYNSNNLPIPENVLPIPYDGHDSYFMIIGEFRINVLNWYPSDPKITFEDVHFPVSLHNKRLIKWNKYKEKDGSSIHNN